MSNSFVRPTSPGGQLKAFSLVEIVVALGIISFAIVGIMGLFPVAMRSAQESQRETRAAFIARQIFSDLKTFHGTNTFVANTTNVLDPGLGINLLSDNAVTVNYNEDGFLTGNSQEAQFEAQISVKANDPVQGLSRVQASIRPTRIGTNASPYNFVTLIDQN